MSKKRWIGPLILTVFVSITNVLYSEEHWETYDSSLVPWERASSIVSFQNALLVAGTPKTSTHTNVFLWRSGPGGSWEDISLPPPILSQPQIITHFQIHGSDLFAFAIENSTFICRVYKSNDGVNWSNGDSGQFIGSISFDDVTSYQGNLYTFDSSGRVWSSNGTGSPPNWSIATSAPFSETGDVAHSFAQKSGRLFLGYGVSGPFSSTSIYEYVGSSNLTFRGSTEIGEILRPSFVEFKGEVYWAGTSLKRFELQGNTISFTSLQAGVFPTPFALNDQLHVIGISGQVLVFSSGSWLSTTEALTPTCVTDRPKFGYPAVVGQTLYMLPCELVSITNGIHNVESTNFNISNPSLDSRNVKALALSFDINFDETASAMTVINTGTADSQSDISQLTLVRASNGAVATTFVPQPDGKTWIFPSTFDLNLTDGDQFEIQFDIAPTAQIGRTIQLRIPSSSGMQFATNSNFSFSALNSPGTFSIADVSRVAETVLVAPNPSKDTANFFYALSSQSDVFIKVFDRSGRLITELTERSKAASNRASTTWDVRPIAPGLYFAHIRIQDENGERSHKTQLVIER